MANTRDDKDLIDRASADPSSTAVHDKDGKLVAWWVPVTAGQAGSFAKVERGALVRGPNGDVMMHDPTIAHRLRTRGDRETLEILVLNDVYNVPGGYITNVGRSEDRQRRPCVIFALNKVGGKLLGEFTASHLPDKSTGFAYNLGIILDDELLSAPSIRDPIYDSGEITGSFTQQDVQDLVTVLNCGRMPRKSGWSTRQSCRRRKPTPSFMGGAGSYLAITRHHPTCRACRSACASETTFRPPRCSRFLASSAMARRL